MIPAFFLLSALALPQTAAPAPASGPVDILGFDDSSGFKLGYHVRSAASDMTELVVPPETVENWTTLITQQTLFDATQRFGGPEGFYRVWRDMMSRGCPGLTATVERGTVEGKPAVKGMLSCPNNPQTAKPENLSAILVQDDADILMIQVAFRRSIGAADAALIRRVNGSVRVCNPPSGRCPRRKNSGFTATGGAD